MRGADDTPVGKELLKLASADGPQLACDLKPRVNDSESKREEVPKSAFGTSRRPLGPSSVDSTTSGHPDVGEAQWGVSERGPRQTALGSNPEPAL